MRLISLCVVQIIGVVVVYSLPYNEAEDKYLDLARKRSDGFRGDVEQNANRPPYKEFNDENSKLDRDTNIPTGDSEINQEEAAYEEYINLAREVADQYMEERQNAKEAESHADIRTASGALRAFNRPSKRTRKISAQIERNNAEIETLMLLASSEKSTLKRKLHNIDLTARSARADPTCDIKIDCGDQSNLNFVGDLEFRTIDGSCNNLKNYTWGMAGTQHRRLLPDAYDNGKWNMRRLSASSTRRPRNDVLLPSPRSISNAVHSTPGHKPDNEDGISLALFYFMQFIDHDLAKTPEGEVGNRKCCEDPRGFCMPIFIQEPGDHFKDNYCMDARRSFTLFRCNDASGLQNQINELSAFVDGSMVYGSSEEEEMLLRQFTLGYLKESARQFMPNSTHPSELGCRVTPTDFCYEAGDKRANVHAGLTTYHTVFVRQHNIIARALAEIRPKWTDERIYQEARKIVGAQIQHIVYKDMLPALIQGAVLDEHGVTDAYSYSESIDPSMTQAFSMAFRYHHMMPHLLHLAEYFPESNSVVQTLDVPQENVFLKPTYLARNRFKGIDEVALGMVVSSCPYVNRLMNKATRDLLFLDDNGDSFDLVVLNLMRGREWGMKSYTEYRALCGLGSATTWDDLKTTTDEDDINKLKAAYTDVRDIDLWTGLVTERKLSGSITGATQSCLLAKHFSNLKHGDRFWYENPAVFPENRLEVIETMTSLARILCDNLDVSTMRLDVFDTDSPWVSCNTIVNKTGGKLNLSSWPE